MSLIDWYVVPQMISNMNFDCPIISCTALTCRLLALHMDPSIKMHVSLGISATSHAPVPLQVITNYNESLEILIQPTFRGSRLQIVGTTTSFDTVTATSIVKVGNRFCAWI